MEAILTSPQNRVQGFLAAGHVCAVMGYWEYPPIAEKYHVPMAITGFEPVDLLTGLVDCISMLEKNKNKVMNSYSRAVTKKGNIAAQDTINKVFIPTDRAWRGIGIIPFSGLSLNDEYAMFDAEKRFDLGYIQAKESEICIAGQILQGNKKPHQCPAFATLCTPENPIGAPMVSNEGACSAYYRYGKKTT
jgi:hydrogenase expression/formation protein HypD